MGGGQEGVHCKGEEWDHNHFLRDQREQQGSLNTYAVNLSRMETNTTLITLLSLLALVAGASFVWVPLLTKVFLDMGGRRSDRAMRVGLVSLVFFIIYHL